MFTDEQPAAAAPTASDKFFRYFQNEVTDLREQIVRIEKHGTSGTERADVIDYCLSAISRLSSEVQDASSYIPSHDKRNYGEAIKTLQSKLQHARAASRPRPKFSFKKSGAPFAPQRNESANSPGDAATLPNQRQERMSISLLDSSNESSQVGRPDHQTTRPNEQSSKEYGAHAGPRDLEQTTPDEIHSSGATKMIRQCSFSESTSINITNHESAHIVLPAAASHATSSGTVSNVKACIIDVSPPTTHGQPFATLTLKSISSSLIICGHVNGATHLTNIQDSIIVVASRQFRMHESSHCNIYLLNTSRPIIEDCISVHFAPLPQRFMNEGDKILTNQWSNVDDFKWLRNEPSPHWSSIEPQRRISDDVWNEVVSGDHHLSTKDILSAVGIKI